VKLLLQHDRPAAARLVKVAFGAFYVGLLLSMVAGLWLLRGTRNVVLAGGMVFVFYYTAVFVPLHTEARYTLPARFFGLLLSSGPIALLLRRWLGVGR
jgi:hypothetical protein